MQTRINPVTGNPEILFNAKLISLGTTTLNLKNEKQTPYRVATVEFSNNDGVVRQVSAIVYEKNASYGMTPGTTYLATATKTPGQEQPLITLSHLVAAERASFSDFDFSFENIVEGAGQVAEALTL